MERSNATRRRGATIAALYGAAALVVVLAVATLAIPALRHRVADHIPPDRRAQLEGLRHGYRVEREVRIAMPDGVHLAASLYLPRRPEVGLATVLVRLPYGRFAYGEARDAAAFFVRRGYAVVVEDLRGTGGSEGTHVPYASAMDDGAATLDWIVAQPWSNGRVGTYGCSALGETQYVLSRARHPALRAMLPSGAGGAVGTAAGRYGYFGVYEGGVFELASAFGWFVEHGAEEPQAPPAAPFDVAAALRGLPVEDLVARQRPGANAYAEFLRRPLADPGWHALGYLDDADLPDVPVFEITTWGDQTVGDTLAFNALAFDAIAARRAGPGGGPERHLIVAPGTHCHHGAAGETGRFGELEVAHAALPYDDYAARWFDRWLRDRGDGLAALPAVRYYMLGEQRWLDTSRWPPPEARPQRWYLGGGGHANGGAGDGTLAIAAPAASAHDEVVDDPRNPVPSRGGPVCCTGEPSTGAGPVDQRAVEARSDVLVYTSAPLRAPLRIAGPLHAVLHVASSAPDTDVVARLVDVWPDGRAINLQEGALRARYRTGFAHPAPLVPGEPVELVVDMRAIACTLPAGHRLRLDIAGSSFPRLERNLHGGGDNEAATLPVVARTRVLHGGATPSYLELSVLPAATD